MTPPDPPREVTYRAATLADAARLADVHLRSVLVADRGVSSEDQLARLSEQLVEREGRWREQLAARPEEPVLVAEQPPLGIIGYAVGAATRKPSFGYDGELVSIYLLPEFQHRGIGRELVRRMVRTLYERGFERVLVRVLTANSARHFYERLAAYPIGVTKVTVGELELEESLYGWPDAARAFEAKSSPTGV
ncbi:MAG: GNAT family N-acetyltransferase [Thermoplasmata archaeon]